MENSKSTIESVLEYYEIRDKDFSYEYDWGYVNNVTSAYWQMRDRLFFSVISSHFNTLKEDLKVLEIGCGYGHEIAKLSLLGIHQSNLSGIDICEHRIDRAKNIYPSINFYSQNATQIMFEDNSFDIVFQFTCLMHIDDVSIQQQICQEMQRVLKPNGIIIWWDATQPSKLVNIISKLNNSINKLKSFQKNSIIANQIKPKLHPNVCFSPEKVVELFPLLDCRQAISAGVDYRIWNVVFNYSSALATYLWNSRLFSHHCFAVFHKHHSPSA
jgi:ubiquinone/menaquinone biosynthesis C-methylase UbiE